MVFLSVLIYLYKYGDEIMVAQSTVDPAQSETVQHARSNTERIVAVETVLPFLATKEDIQKLKSDLTWRIIIAMGVQTAIFTAIITAVVTNLVG